MKDTNDERCIVDISKPSVYAFESDKKAIGEILQEAVSHNAKAIEKWKNILAEDPTVEWAKTYLEADSKAEFVIMTYSEFEIKQRAVLLGDPLSEITEERFNDMFECLPPLRWCTIGKVEMFCCGEMLTGFYASQYAHDKDRNKFYTKVVDVKDESTWINTMIEPLVNSSYMKLEFVGMDNWDNPVYKDEEGKYWKDLGYSSNKPDFHTTAGFDADPDRSISSIKKYKNVKLEFSPKRIICNPRSFDYQMLGRLQADCEYYLGFGCRSPERLWANNEKDQIEKMKFIWNSFPSDGKPEWLTLEQIEKYESQMVLTKETGL